MYHFSVFLAVLDEFLLTSVQVWEKNSNLKNLTKQNFTIKKKQVQILSKMKQKTPIIFKIFVLRYNILAINLMKLFKNKKM